MPGKHSGVIAGKAGLTASLFVAALLAVPAGLSASSATTALTPENRVVDFSSLLFCSAEVDPPAYYEMPLVSTKRVPGTGGIEGLGQIYFDASPFGINVTTDGSYLYRLRIDVNGLPDRPGGEYVAWLTTRNLEEIVRIGTIGDDGLIEGHVEWNKFLVVITLEPETAVASASADNGSSGTGQAASKKMWTGPIVMRGMSRSGAMHTMAGHGPFQRDNCAAFGYN